ncbi:hypothetical protein [Roseobacter litoralis]|uniref:Uncharacterized protein n=1 Tax=Roseobacter litoralis (strain ATCC 49566 / DSM 6996 / JCM 21268 / NBRC 15278 / OCh 149) TaxID=391595 RepID=F7ZJN1_ROSLO|nr:hypothetical protein [Roseobacter litoralis]AEI93862.1 hypothetical protein RLO149_c018740 [Roseobacter litoralis Och 149]
MIAEIGSWFATHWPDVIPIGLATLALLYSALAHDTARRAFKASQSSDTSHLRIAARSARSDVQQSLIALKEKCRVNRHNWENHPTRRFPVLSLEKPEEFRVIADVERTGELTIRKFNEAYVLDQQSSGLELEAYITAAQQVVLKIDSQSRRLMLT